MTFPPFPGKLTELDPDYPLRQAIEALATQSETFSLPLTPASSLIRPTKI